MSELTKQKVEEILSRAEAAKNYTPGGPVAPAYPSTMIEVCTALLEALDREERLKKIAGAALLYVESNPKDTDLIPEDKYIEQVTKWADAAENLREVVEAHFALATRTEATNGPDA